MIVNYKNPISGIIVSSPTSVNPTDTFGTNFSILGGEGGGEDKSSLEKFTDILVKIDTEKLFSLWVILSKVYDIRDWLVNSSLGKIYNKMMHP